MNQHASLTRTIFVLAACTVPLVGVQPATAQFGEEIVVFNDQQTGAACSVVNAANASLIVLFDTGNFVLVDGADTRLSDYVVANDNTVFFGEKPAGIVDFTEDADGLPTLFWMTLVGTVVQIDSFSAAPSDSGLLPDEFTNTGCDACDFLDDQTQCAPVDDGTNGGNPADDSSVFFDLCGAGTTQAMIALAVGLPLCRRRR